MELELHKNWWLFFIELELHSNLEFHKLKFQKIGKSLIILQIVVDYQIFPSKMVFGHFGHDKSFVSKRIVNVLCLVDFLRYWIP